MTNVYVTQQVQAPAMAAVYVGPPKSMATSVILTVLFGPLGLFYANTKLAVIMLIVSIVAAIFTATFSLLITYPICIVLAITEINKHNQMLAAAAGGNVQIANAPRP